MIRPFRQSGSLSHLASICNKVHNILVVGNFLISIYHKLINISTYITEQLILLQDGLARLFSSCQNFYRVSSWFERRSGLKKRGEIHRISRTSIALVDCTALEEYGRLGNKMRPSEWTNYNVILKVVRVH